MVRSLKWCLSCWFGGGGSLGLIYPSFCWRFLWFWKTKSLSFLSSSFSSNFSLDCISYSLGCSLHHRHTCGCQCALDRLTESLSFVQSLHGAAEKTLGALEDDGSKQRPGTSGYARENGTDSLSVLVPRVELHRSTSLSLSLVVFAVCSTSGVIRSYLYRWHLRK